MRILMVDDSESVRDLLGRFLRDVGEVDEACDGREAVDKFKVALEDGQGYDLVLLDILMPVMDGRRALAEIRGIERERGVEYIDEVRVLMVTAVDDEEAMLEAAFQGRTSGYIVKPLRKDDLMAKLKEMEIIIRDAF